MSALLPQGAPAAFIEEHIFSIGGNAKGGPGGAGEVGLPVLFRHTVEGHVFSTHLAQDIHILIGELLPLTPAIDIVHPIDPNGTGATVILMFFHGGADMQIRQQDQQRKGRH